MMLLLHVTSPLTLTLGQLPWKEENGQPLEDLAGQAKADHLAGPLPQKEGNGQLWMEGNGQLRLK
jgi:hypothetical protein